MNRDIKFLLFVVIVASTVGLLSGALTVERWIMVQVLILTYVCPSPLSQSKDKEE